MGELKYDVDQIETMDFKRAMRRHVAMYAGSADNSGVFQVFKEILGNAIDEHLNGFGNSIEVVIGTKGDISVKDYGRGIPFSTDLKDTTFIDIFTSSHTSGKFNHKAYKTAVGLHGIGVKLAAYSSENFEARSFRDGNEAIFQMEGGEIKSYKISPKKGSKTYSLIRYKPDPSVFHVEKIDINPKRIVEFCRISSFLNPGLEIKVENKIDKKKHNFKAKGIQDLILEDYPDRFIPPVTYKVKDETDDLEICYTWTNNRRERFHVFVNGMEISEGGSPVTGFRSSLTRSFNHLAKTKFNGDSIRQGIVYIINIKCLNPSFSDQRKSQIQNPNLRTLASQAINESLKDFSLGSDFEKIKELLSKIEKADAAAERARKQVLETTREIEKNQKRKVFASDKLKDAEFLGMDSTLLLVEGNSAAASMAVARDPKKYGVLALRGKPINVLSNPDEKIFDNEEVKLILSALNLRPGRYDARQLRYGKVAIAADSDSDGNHIALLLMALFHGLAPGLIEDGKLYWLKGPLHIRTKGKKKYYYYNDEEFAAAKETGGTLSRAKGLGSLSAEEAKESMFGKAQRMEQLKGTQEALEVLEDLMGEDINYRREFVFNKIDFANIGE